MKDNTVPHIVVKTRCRVTLEPELQAEIGSMRPAARRALARKFYRWAKQLYKSADIIEFQEQPLCRPRRIRWLPVKKARCN